MALALSTLFACSATAALATLTLAAVELANAWPAMRRALLTLEA